MKCSYLISILLAVLFLSPAISSAACTATAPAPPSDCHCITRASIVYLSGHLWEAAG